MNWEAVGAIGVVVGAFGAILLVPGLLWARRIARKRHDTTLASHVTRVGFLFHGATVLLMLLGLAIPALISGTWLDRPGGTLATLIAYYSVLAFAARRAEVALDRRGIKTLSAREVGDA